MKLFKYFTYKELKDICQKLEKNGCYYRHPKSDFVKHLGKETVENLLKSKCIKNSKRLDAYWIDYYEECYEYCNLFRKVYNYFTTPFWLWLKIYVLNVYWFVRKWQSFRIWCGHHYDWQDYDKLYYEVH